MKNKIKYIVNKAKYLKENKKKYNNLKRKKIVLMGSPEYNNLGDHAIAYATKVFIHDNFKDYDYLEIEENEIIYNFKEVKKHINKDDILLLQGGGNMGDMYKDQVMIRKKVIKTFKNNHIIIMPQTIYFTKANSKLPKYYFKHRNLDIFARENKSYKILKELYMPEKVHLVPDIVMYLINNNGDYKRKNSDSNNNILICIRNDKESKKIYDKERIKDIVKKQGKMINEISTVVEDNVMINEREKRLKNLFETFEKSDLLITDRLHGMIIAAIVGTPCIVLPTFNHKVIESYKWIEELDYIQIINNFEEIEQMINFYLNKYDWSKQNTIKLEYSKLIKVIKE